MLDNSQQAQSIVSPLELEDAPISNPTGSATISEAAAQKVAADASEASKSDAQHFRSDRGRRYHAFEERQYWLPNDDIEISRLDIQHHIWRLAMNGGLHASPMPRSAKQVLDVGTGTGAWAIDIANAYPDVQVLGTDLSPIQPKEGVPPNCTFQVHNAEADWEFPQKFDFILARMLLMGIHDWPLFFKKAYENLNPGGWLEVSNPEFPFKHLDPSVTSKTSPVLRWSGLIQEAAGKDGIDTLLAIEYEPLLKAQGFVNIKAWPHQWPCSPWAKGDVEKKMGQWMIPNLKAFIRPSAQALLTKRLGWREDQVEELVAAAEEEARDTKNHLSCKFWVWSAQKSENA